MMSWAGLRVTLGPFGLVIAFVAAAGLLVLILRKQRMVLIESGPGRFHRPIGLGFAQGLALFPFAVAVLLLAAGFLISIARGYSLFDRIANWALKGYTIAYEGTVFAGARWGGHNLEYPQNVHLLIALFRLLDGDALPGSKLLFPALPSCLLLGLYRFPRRAGGSVVFAGLALFTLLPVPVLYCSHPRGTDGHSGQCS